ncbi:MAG: VC_2705 family sodium/solute symporter [Hyphomicrobiales bacterium]|nr:VC_2705 family sodium/solute symporter [Hyphomicrobiales bacterium]
MSLNTHYAVVNPRLGASFAIFTSAFVCLVLMLVILEQLGLSRTSIGQIMALAPIGLYLFIGVMARTIAVDDFFISGQRVPPLYNGLSLTVNALGATAALSLTGALLFAGLDAMAIGAGVVAGVAALAILFGAQMRKVGAFTLPGFFGLRFNSRALRFAAALLLIPPCILIFAAEAKLAGLAASFLLPDMGRENLTALAAAAVVACVILGGMRGLTWTQCAQTIVLFIGLGAPVVIVSLMLTNLPIPQLTYGYVVQELSQLEVAKSLTSSAGATVPPSQAFASEGFAALTQPFAKLFSSIDEVDFVLLALCVMLGGAALPIQIARLSTTPTVGAVRKSLGWSVLLTGALVMTLPAYAAFIKFYVAQDLSGQPLSEIPAWGQQARSLGLLTITGDALNPALGESETRLLRDAAALILPLAGKTPYALFGLVAAAAIAAALAAAGAQLVSIANALSNDVHYNLVNRAASPAKRLLIARLSIIGAAIVGAWLAAQPGYDPLMLVLWALSIVAGTFFPALALAVWWTRTNGTAILFGMIAGFIAAVGVIAMGEAGGPFGVDSVTAGAVAAPVSALVIVVMSVMARAPDEEAKEFVEDMRISAGETLYARALRLAARGRSPRI